MDGYRDEIRKIMISVNALEGIYTQAAKKVGVKENTLAFLYALDDGKNHSQKKICQEWMIPKTTLNTIVKECVEAGYVILEPEGHTKEKEIRLTEEGKNYTRKVLNQIYEVEKRAFESTLREYSAEFPQAISRFSSHLYEEAKKYFGEHQSEG